MVSGDDIIYEYTDQTRPHDLAELRLLKPKARRTPMPIRTFWLCLRNSKEQSTKRSRGASEQLEEGEQNGGNLQSSQDPQI